MVRWLGADDPVVRVAVVGGTHGNERNGVYLRKIFEAAARANPPPSPRSFETVFVEGNPEAVVHNTRYCDLDLNRQFELETLATAAAKPPNTLRYEERRAQELDAQLGPKTSPTPRCDVIIDLHTTTAPCEIALLMHPRDQFSHEIAARLIEKAEELNAGGGAVAQKPIEVKIVNWADRDPRVLPSVARSGFTFEVGPIPWGVVSPVYMQHTHALLQAALEYIDERNRMLREGVATRARVARSVPVFKCDAGGPIPYPKDASGALWGMVHHGLVDLKTPLARGVPVLTTFGTFADTLWEDVYDVDAQGDAALFPLFVNEAAYYESDIAFCVARRVEVDVAVLPLGGK